MEYKNSKQEVGDNLSVSVLIIFTEVSTLPSLVAITLVKVRMYFYQLASDQREVMQL